MKILVIIPAADGLQLCIDFAAAGHDVKVWMAPREGEIGRGLVDLVPEWKPYMKWADMIVITYNSKYVDEFEPFFRQGYPIFGCNRDGLRLEKDRGFGMEILESAGVETLPFETFTDLDKGIAHIRKTGKTYVCKPLTDDDRGMSYVADDPADMEYKLGEFKRRKLLKKGFILQEKISGIEMAVGGWFGPGGFSAYVNENWEEKRLMNEGLGINTGEQGTIMRYVKRSKLAAEVLFPVEAYLHSIQYVGYIDVNCIIDDKGCPWPLEFTMRFGWPHFDIARALHEGDSAKWMADLLDGKDTLEVSENDIAAGVVLGHGDYPYGKMSEDALSGVPIYGINAKNTSHLAFCKVKMAPAPIWLGGKTVIEDLPVTAGDEILIAIATAKTVLEARDLATERAWSLRLPTNVGFRTDIGCRLEDSLPTLQKFGYAKGMRYGNASKG